MAPRPGNTLPSRFQWLTFIIECASDAHSGGTVQELNLVVYSLPQAVRLQKHMRLYINVHILQAAYDFVNKEKVFIAKLPEIFE